MPALVTVPHPPIAPFVPIRRDPHAPHLPITPFVSIRLGPLFEPIIFGGDAACPLRGVRTDE